MAACPYEGARIHLAIDAVNIRQGGGLTHLSRLLAHADPVAAGIQRVSVWVNAGVAQQLPVAPWLSIHSASWMSAALPVRIAGQQWVLPAAMRDAGCDVLFSPGGSISSRLRNPVVTLSQNMLPFEAAERRRFPRGVTRAKLFLLAMTQGHSFRRATGVIFLSRYAQAALCAQLGIDSKRTALIPHGIDVRFRRLPRPARVLSDCSPSDPLRLLYVSIAMPYKHQLELVQAVHQLQQAGLPLRLDLVGAGWQGYGRRLQALLDQLDPQSEHLVWHGEVDFATLHEHYHAAEVFVFASSCENLPNILLEAMAAGLPIACSDRGPMPEVLGEAGVYFNPDDVGSIAAAIRTLAKDPELRERLALQAYQQSLQYSWETCAKQTFGFLAQVAAEADTN